jgi:hypothetical protein
MKIVILRRECLIISFICIGFLLLFFASLVNFTDGEIELINDVLGTLGLLLASFIFLWMLLRNDLQVFWFKKDGIYSHLGFKKYLHFAYKNVKEIKVVTFECPPKFKSGEKIRGVDSILTPPEKPPAKWIVITDGRENLNLYNYNSYLVPVRKHMVIKFEYSPEREKMLHDYVKCDIEYCKVTLDEMITHTPKSQTL